MPVAIISTKILLICCFAAAVSAKSEQEVKMWLMERAAPCVNDYQVTDEEMLLMDKHTIPESKNAKCFITCVFRKADWVDDKGMFSKDNAVKMAEENHSDEPEKIENAKKLFELCNSVNDQTYSGADSECDRGAALAQCFIDNAPKMGFRLM